MALVPALLLWLVARLRWERLAQGDKGVLQVPWGESPIINRWQQHPDSVTT